MRKGLSIAAIGLVLTILVVGCGGGKPVTQATVKQTFDKITVGMDVRNVMETLGPTGPDFGGGIDINGQNTFSWVTRDGVLMATVTFENGKVVSKEWKGVQRITPEEEPGAAPPPAK